jgi:Zn-dependent M28 family amino/carboxypeptidase
MLLMGIQNEISRPLIEYVRDLEDRESQARGQRVIANLKSIGLDPTIQSCRWPRLRNIIVDFMPDSTAKRLLFSAHYDVVKDSPGANDNASGVAVLLGLCSHLSKAPEPARIVFFDREECWFRTPLLNLGLLGSLYYAWKTDLQNVASVYNLEFCGQGDFLVIWPIKGKEINLAAVRRVQAVASRLGVPFQSAHIPWQLFSSDHLSFRLRGFANAVTLSLLPSGQVPILGEMLATMSFPKLLIGQRPILPEPLSYIHSHRDNSAKLDEKSLGLMLSLLLGLIRDDFASR